MKLGLGVVRQRPHANKPELARVLICALHGNFPVLESRLRVEYMQVLTRLSQTGISFTPSRRPIRRNPYMQYSASVYVYVHFDGFASCCSDIL